MDGFVVKPINFAILLGLIEALTGARETRANGDIRQNSNGDFRQMSKRDIPRTLNGALDEGAFLASVGNDRVLMAELAQIFLDELQPRMLEIRGAISDGDTGRLRFAAHTLKGSAGAITAKRAALAAGSLETMAQSENLEGAPELLAQLETEIDQLRERLAEMGARN